MSSIRVLFMGTPAFAVPALKQLIEDDHFSVVGVFSQPDRPAGRRLKLEASPVKQLALAHELNVWTPENVNKSEIYEQVSSLGAEAAVVVAFGQILSQEFLDLFPRGIVNVHASLLPRWRGAAPIQRSLMAGDLVTGVSLQKMVRQLDAGDVLGVRTVDITEEMNALDLHDQLAERGADLVHIEFMDYLRGHLIGEQQQEAYVTYAPKIAREEACINWTEPAPQVAGRIRGLAMWPGAWSLWKGKKMKFFRARAASQSLSPTASPGEVVDVLEDSIVIQCGKGAVALTEAQPESKRRQPMSQLVQGYGFQIGDRFESQE